MLLSLKQLNYAHINYAYITLELVAKVSEGSRRSSSLKPASFFSLILDH